MIIELTITFLAGAIFAGTISYIGIKMMSRAKVPETCHEKCKRIKELNYENVSLENRYKIVMADNKSILNNQTKYLTDISKELKK